VVCFGKTSLSDIPIRNNQAASDRASAMAEGPSKWRGRRKRTEFRACWSVVGCRSILLEISNWEFLIVQSIYKGVEDFHICSCCDGCVEEDGNNYVPPGHPTPNTILLWMKGFFMYRVGIFTCPNPGTYELILFNFRCNIFIGVRIIKEMPSSVASETHCITRQAMHV